MSDDDDELLRGGQKFAEELTALKERGSIILISGEVPASTAAQVSSKFFGSADDDRHRVLGRVDLSEECTQSHLPPGVSTDHPTTTVVDYATNGVRDPAVAQPATHGGVTPDPLSEFRLSLFNAISQQRTGRTLSFGELRVGVVSLRILIEEHGIEAVKELVQTVGSEAVVSNGMAFFCLGLPSDTPEAKSLCEIADIHVQLRWRKQYGGEQNFRLLDAGVDSGWSPLANE